MLPYIRCCWLFMPRPLLHRAQVRVDQLIVVAKPRFAWCTVGCLARPGGLKLPTKSEQRHNLHCIWSGPIKLSAISSACCTTLHCVLFVCTQQRLPVCCIILTMYAAGLILVASMWAAHMRHTPAPDSNAVLLAFDAVVQTRCHTIRSRRAEQSRSMMLGRRVYYILCCTVLCSGIVVISRKYSLLHNCELASAACVVLPL